jgi:lysophospholipase L1-like esterase
MTVHFPTDIWKRLRQYGLCIATIILATIPVAQARAEDYQSSPARRTVQDRDWGPWLGPFRAQLVPSLMQDFGERYLYAGEDAKLPPPAPGEQRVVFLGDSITDRWNLARSFPGKAYVNRGIGSQVTAQMILRFHQDVIALKPKLVVILAGVNDVQGFLQQESEQQIETNFETMADLADRHGIKPVFASILPVNNYSERAAQVLDERRPDELRRINAWLRSFCAARGYVYADYFAALVDAKGLMRRGLTEDGVHPLDAGYALMAPIAEAAIEKALAAR